MQATRNRSRRFCCGFMCECASAAHVQYLLAALDTGQLRATLVCAVTGSGMNSQVWR